jgi:hypothetical protein
MIFAPLILGLAALSWSQGGSAADDVRVDAPQMIRTFEGICLDHIGDARAQGDTAFTAVWNFVPDRPIDGEVRYRSRTGALGIRESTGFCALSSELHPGIDLASFQTAMSQSLSLERGTPLPNADSVYWLIATDDTGEQYVIALKVSVYNGRNLATLTLQKRPIQ